jgi:predicted Fe-S protein YdhL (DUF1289 family)
MTIRPERMAPIVEMVPPRRIVSPCVNLCRIDRETRRCAGCARSLDEIARGTTMSDTERDRILAELPGRKAS